jgi:predicted TIM-barrel fold metal-dependent hydrolase
MKIDIFGHFMAEDYQTALKKHMGAAYRSPEPWISDVDQRLRLLDKYGTAQILAPSGPPLESIADPKKAAELARIANDSIAEIVSKHPEQFLSAVALIPTNNIEAALEEIDRCVKTLKLKGIYLFTPQIIFSKTKKKLASSATTDHSVGDLPTETRALDSPDLFPLYEKMAKYDLPIWIHPRTTPAFADYSTEDVSKYRIWHIFGWPYHTTAAMTRLVFSGVFEKYPGIKFIAHHAGAMVPFFDRRIEVLYDTAEKVHGGGDNKLVKKKPLEYFRMFYADTAVNGSTPALECAQKFFGTEHMLFGSDAPHDYGMGEVSLKDTILSIEGMDISKGEKQAIFETNARTLLHLKK